MNCPAWRWFLCSSGWISPLIFDNVTSINRSNLLSAKANRDQSFWTEDNPPRSAFRCSTSIKASRSIFFPSLALSYLFFFFLRIWHKNPRPGAGVVISSRWSKVQATLWRASQCCIYWNMCSRIKEGECLTKRELGFGSRWKEKGYSGFSREIEPAGCIYT